ncbi:MAG: glycosyltransferase, partial [Clostridia bacterium]
MQKKIHYCWFGGKKLPKEVEQCIATWKKFLPDYEIKEWNESNFDINTCTFVKEAYKNKKWAFVSDYVRIYALYQEGGIYFDTDMKIIKDVSNIVDKEMFLGYEDSGYVGTAVIGVKEKNNKYIKEILEYYNKIDHFDADIIYNYANPVIITRILKKYDSRTDKNGIRIFDDNVYIYPREYFYPLSYNYAERVYTENTCMVHLFSATWTDKGERRTIGIYRKFGPDVGKVLNRIIDGLFSLKGKSINGLKKIYNFARMKYSIYVNREKRVNRIKEELTNKKEKYIVICHPEMTEKSDVQILFKENILDIREQYTEKEACQIAREIIDSGKELVIFNSYADGWNRIISELKNIKRNIIIKVLIHNGNELLADS